MSIKPANMDDCFPKCECLFGPNTGLAYACDDPCPDGTLFTDDFCDCIDLSEYNYVRFVGTIETAYSETDYTGNWIDWTSAVTGDALGLTGLSGGFSTRIMKSEEDYIDFQYDSTGTLWRTASLGWTPWRSTVSSEVIAEPTNVAFPGYIWIGGIGVNGPNPDSNPSIGVGSTTLGDFFRISGIWEFSDDQTEILLQWDGN